MSCLLVSLRRRKSAGHKKENKEIFTTSQKEKKRKKLLFRARERDREWEREERKEEREKRKNASVRQDKAWVERARKGHKKTRIRDRGENENGPTVSCSFAQSFAKFSYLRVSISSCLCLFICIWLSQFVYRRGGLIDGGLMLLMNFFRINSL